VVKKYKNREIKEFEEVYEKLCGAYSKLNNLTVGDVAGNNLRKLVEEIFL